MSAFDLEHRLENQFLARTSRQSKIEIRIWPIPMKKLRVKTSHQGRARDLHIYTYRVKKGSGGWSKSSGYELDGFGVCVPVNPNVASENRP